MFEAIQYVELEKYRIEEGDCFLVFIKKWSFLFFSKIYVQYTYIFLYDWTLIPLAFHFVGMHILVVKLIISGFISYLAYFNWMVWTHHGLNCWKVSKHAMTCDNFTNLAE